MLTYIDLKDLKVKTINSNGEIITKGTYINVPKDLSILELSSLMKHAAKNLVADLDEDKIYNFAFDLLGEIEEEEFETAVNVILAVFFEIMTDTKLGRPRERRLDVPENLKKEVNCNMSLLKRAINYKTVVDRFQLTIGCRSLQYILVGGYDE